MAFASRGFYLHTSWKYEYPFAVRTWKRADFRSMFKLLRMLDMDKVMIWPLVETAPPPLCAEDAAYFTEFRDVVNDAKKTGLECWLSFTPNLTVKDEVRAVPIRDRVFYPSKRVYRFDNPAELTAYLKHVRGLLTILDNADGYVFIDGDPGGYPGAKPVEYLAMLNGVRRILDNACGGRRPKLIHWVWSGWGADWEKDGCWRSDLKSLVSALLDALKADPPSEPWELLPGRHLSERRGNGRQTFDLVEQAGLLERSSLLTYEIVELEPTPPAFVNQFEDIRRVIRQEMKYAFAVRGVFGNAQQPLTALQNLFYFAQCARDPSWLDQPDEHVFSAFADFLGGDARVLSSALNILLLSPVEMPNDLDRRIRELSLKSEAAAFIPGGSDLYLDILARFVRARLDVTASTAVRSSNATEAAACFQKALSALVGWWRTHKYVYSGESGTEFQLAHTHRFLLKPLKDWLENERGRFDARARKDLAQFLVADGPMSGQAAAAVLKGLFGDK